MTLKTIPLAPTKGAFGGREKQLKYKVMPKKHLFSWTGYYAQQLVSATIEDAAKANIVLTFSKSTRPFLNAVASEFTVTGTAKTVDSITVDTANKTLTVTVTVAYASGNTCTLVHNPASPNKGATTNTVVTNNIP